MAHNVSTRVPGLAPIRIVEWVMVWTCKPGSVLQNAERSEGTLISLVDTLPHLSSDLLLEEVTAGHRQRVLRTVALRGSCSWWGLPSQYVTVLLVGS